MKHCRSISPGYRLTKYSYLRLNQVTCVIILIQSEFIQLSLIVQTNHKSQTDEWFLSNPEQYEFLKNKAPSVVLSIIVSPGSISTIVSIAQDWVTIVISRMSSQNNCLCFSFFCWFGLSGNSWESWQGVRISKISTISIVSTRVSTICVPRISLRCSLSLSFSFPLAQQMGYGTIRYSRVAIGVGRMSNNRENNFLCVSLFFRFGFSSDSSGESW